VPRTDEHIEDASRGGDLLDGECLVEAHPIVPAGQVFLGDRRHDGGAHLRPAHLSAGIKQARLGLEEGGGRVEDVASRMHPGGAVGTAVALGSVMQRRRREPQRAGDGQFRDVLGGGETVIRRRKAHPVQYPVSFGEQLVASVGGMAIGDSIDNGFGSIGEDRLAQVGAAQQR
jgi:hypothetical protein